MIVRILYVCDSVRGKINGSNVYACTYTVVVVLLFAWLSAREPIASGFLQLRIYRGARAIVWNIFCGKRDLIDNNNVTDEVLSLFGTWHVLLQRRARMY